jgi:hypothetical protein
MPGYCTVRSRRRCAGTALMGILMFILIGSTLLAGVANLTIMQYKRTYQDATYAAALDAADAGINYEIQYLTANNTCHVSGSPGTGSFGSNPWRGTFSVVDTQVGGAAITTPSSPPSSITITSTGTVGSTSRKVSITATQGGGSYNYGVFSKISGVINGAQTVQGSVGTAGTVVINGSNTISDQVIGLHGGSATATINPQGSFTTQVRPTITWPNVSDIATDRFGSSWATYLASNNDNALSSASGVSGQLNGSNVSGSKSPAIANNKITANGSGTVTLGGKAGGANYFLTSSTFNGTWNVILDNSLGPINIWCIGSSGTTFVFNGGNSTVSMTTDPSKACKVYVGNGCNLTLNGNGIGRYGVYAINPSTTGTVTLNGNNNLYGSVIANKYTFNGVNTVNYTTGYFTAPGGGWQFGGNWLENLPR